MTTPMIRVLLTEPCRKSLPTIRTGRNVAAFARRRVRLTRLRQKAATAHCLSHELGLLNHRARFANGALFAQLGATAGFARLLVILAFPQLFLNATAFEQFLEAAQGQANRLSFVNTHP